MSNSSKHCALLSLLLAVAGCSLVGDEGDRTVVRGGDRDAAAAADGAPIPTSPDLDGGAGTDEFAGLRADPDRSAGGEPGLAGGSTDSPAETAGDSARTCYDGIDNDMDGAFDCGSAACLGLASCCVGSATCCEPAPGPSGDLSSFHDCFGLPIDSCLAGVKPFGDPLPFVVRDRSGASWLQPGGDDRYDSGIIYDDPVDLATHRLRIAARLAQAIGCDGTCREGVAVGVTEQTELDVASHVRPVAALLLSGARGTVSLVIDDVLVREWDFATVGGGDASLPQQWYLTLRPDGRIVVEVPTGELFEASFMRRAPVRVVVYGRSRNPGTDTPLGARVGSVTTEVSLCDMTAAWSDRGAAVISVPRTTGTVDVPDVDAPTVVRRDDGTTWFAIETRAGIAWGRRQSESVPHELAMYDPATSLAIAHEPPYEGCRVGDPELVEDAGTLRMLFTVGGCGDDRIEVATAPAGEGRFGSAIAVLRPSEIGATGIDDPTIAQHVSGMWVMVARAHYAGERSRFVALLARSLEGPWTRVIGGDVETVGADADEIAEPSLTIHHYAWHLHYAARQGTRWSVALVTSDELLYWRAFGTVVEPSAQAYDRLGVSAPDVVANRSSLEMFYVGRDGARGTLARTGRLGATTSWGSM